MTVRCRTGSVVLGLLVTLATVLGVACLCTHGHAMQPVAAMSSASYPAHHGPDGDDREHVCAAPGHDQCGARAAVDNPTTGPGPHPQPQGLPVRVDTRPALVMAQNTAYGTTVPKD